MAEPVTESPRWSLAHALGLGAAVLAFVVALRPLDDNSFLTHLATGRLILEHGVPSADPYTAVAAGHHWVVQSWLPSVIYALVERSAGAHGLLLLNGALVAALAGAVWALSSPARTLIGRIALVGPTIAVGSVVWSERPLLFGLLCLALLALLIRGDRKPWLAVPLLWVWGQSHGSWPLALVVVALVLVGEGWDGRIERAHLQLAAAVAVGSAAIAVGPNGIGALTFPFEMLSRSAVLRYITEWRPASFLEPWPWVHVILLALGGGAIAWNRDRRAAPVLAFAIATSFLALRNIPVAAVLVVFAAGPSVSELRWGGFDGRRPSGVVPALGLSLVAVVALVRSSNDPAYRLDDYPVAVLARLNSVEGHGEVSGPGVMYDSTVGNLIEVLTPARNTVFIDDRIEVLPASFAHDFVAMVDLAPGWERYLDEYEIDSIVWRAHAPIVEALMVDPRWRLANGDSRWVQLVRRPRETGQP